MFHAHAHSTEDIWRLRYGTFDRFPDLVVWPGEHADVEAIVKAAVAHNVVLIPYGSGTNVTNALQLDAKETRMIVSVDMHEMHHLKWIDTDSLTACIEAGAVGKDIESNNNKTISQPKNF